MQMMFFPALLLVIIGTSTVSAAVGTVTTGYAVMSGTFTDNTCSTAISYQLIPLGICIPNDASGKTYKWTSDGTAIIPTVYASMSNCVAGTGGTDSTLAPQACLCTPGGSCKKSGYYSASIPAMPGPYKTSHQYDGATVCTGTVTYLSITGVDPAAISNFYCEQSTCLPNTPAGDISRVSVTICTVPTGTGTLTGYYQRSYYPVSR